MWVQEGRNWHFGENWVFVDLQKSSKNTQFKTYFKSEVKVMFFLWAQQEKKKPKKQKKHHDK